LGAAGWVAAGAEVLAPVWLGARGVLLARGVDEAGREVDLMGLEIGLEVEVGVWVTTVVVIVGVGVGVGVLVEQSPVTVTAIQLMFLESRVCVTVTVPCAAEQEA
jgi:hypothetical protein